MERGDSELLISVRTLNWVLAYEFGSRGSYGTRMLILLLFDPRSNQEVTRKGIVTWIYAKAAPGASFGPHCIHHSTPKIGADVDDIHVTAWDRGWVWCMTRRELGDKLIEIEPCCEVCDQEARLPFALRAFSRSWRLHRRVRKSPWVESECLSLSCHYLQWLNLFTVWFSACFCITHYFNLSAKD